MTCTRKDDYTRHLAKVIDDKAKKKKEDDEAKKKKEDDEAKKKEDGKAKEKDSASTSKLSAGKKTSAPLKAPKQTTKGKKKGSFPARRTGQTIDPNTQSV
ncbi:hypothetical protein QYE76_048028 [Lolium multiflorum]|uniref:Uncharacterized protein n=1 Tax=Lolium multiflorum TaxID=4521 RepID=A0AAD8X054_LOLMU|nr:hypothetical protein QYE76_048028 [Lolium multiflorum]